MPDIGQWVLLLVLAGGVAVAVGWPLRRAAPPSIPGVDTEGAELRHRVALEALHDVEADHGAGSLDEDSYLRQRDEAEERAAATLAEVEAAGGRGVEPTPRSGGRRAAAVLASLLAIALLGGFALPAPFGLAERTVVDQALADAQKQEKARLADIQRLLNELAADPRNTTVLSELADAYLAGSTAEDLRRAAVSLQVLISLAPQNRSAYRRLVTAYISAADWADARAASDSYAGFAADDPDIPFFRGLIALRGDRDTAEAIRQFDRFLQLAPDDPRAAMVRSLRADAAGELSGASPSSGS
jgi:tetratricopeptide (TPR) repeat protein